jgi:hypothetical protein
MLGVGALLIALRWNSLDAPLVRDEGEYAYAAQILKRGMHPYQDAFLQKPPMIVYTYAAAQAIAPHTFWFPRVLAALFAAGAAGVLGWIACLEFGPGVALPAVWLVTPMLLAPGLEQFTANTEMFMVLPLLGVFALYATRRHGQGGAAAWFFAGALGAVAVWYKYTCLPVLALLFVVWTVQEWRVWSSRFSVSAAQESSKNSMKAELQALPVAERSSRFTFQASRLVRRWLLLLLGACLASLAILAPFLIRGGGTAIWQCTVVFNRFYRESATFGWSGLLSCARLFWLKWWILFLLLAVLVFRPRPRPWLWISMFLLAWLSTGASVFGQYYLLVMPFWALLAAVAINELASLAAPRLGLPVRWVGWATTATVLVLVCAPDLPLATCSRQEFAAAKAGGGNAFLESQTVARRLAELTKPSDRVFVAGSEPQILFYADRLSSTRFVLMYPLLIPTPLARGFQAEAIRDLERHPPAAIVFAPSPLSWLPQKDSPPEFLHYLDKLVPEHYELVGGWVVDAEGGRWQEPLADQDRANSSLVIFRRKAS